MHAYMLNDLLFLLYLLGMGQRIDEYKINKGVFAFMVILCFFLVFYQFYLERIFYVMWIKVFIQTGS